MINEEGVFMKKWGKVVAVTLVAAMVFGIWQGPIKSRAEKLASKDYNDSYDEQDENIDKDEEFDIPEEEIVDKFTVSYEDSYAEYVYTEQFVYCTFYQYTGEDENGNPIYDKKSSKTEVMSDVSDRDMDDDSLDNSEEKATDNVTRDESTRLYWQKIVRENLKKVYYYQVGVKGKDVFYRIGGEQSVAVNYSKLTDDAANDIQNFIDQVDLVNKQLTQCILAAIGAVMLAISAIIASYVAVGSAICSNFIAPILKQFGVQLISLSPIGFGQMVFKMYDDYQDLKAMYCQAATHGSIFTQQ